MDEGQRLRFFESPMKEDAADDRPGLEYSSGKDSDMDMGEEVGEEVGEAVHMGEGMGVRARRAARQKGSSTGPMKEDADRAAAGDRRAGRPVGDSNSVQHACSSAHYYYAHAFLTL